MKHYKKFCVRALPVYAAQYWYTGDMEALPRLTDGSVRLEPLFVHRCNAGVTVYYESSLVDDGPQHLFEYYRDNPHKLDALTEEYRRIAQENPKYLSEATIEHIREVFDLNAHFVFPFTTIIYQLGNQDREDLREVATVAKNTRHWDDKVIYGPGFRLYDLISEKFSLPIPEWPAYVTIEEALHHTAPHVDVIHERKANWVYHQGMLHGGIHDIDAFLYEKDVTLEKEVVDTNQHELRGRVAHGGTATGLVRIVRTFNDMEDFQEGEILVSPMTSPDFTPVIHKALAIVTDEGGVTCHAAIVSRELQIPCIVGTRVATHVLRNSDRIEVNMRRGIVTRLQ